MLQLNHFAYDLAFEHPFTISKGTKTHQPTLIVSLGLSNMRGFGEAPAISYYNVTVAGMVDMLEAKRNVIERYALMDPKRFWHFLHHLIPEQHFLIAALDIAGWDLFAQMRRMPLYRLLGLDRSKIPQTDYTIGLDSIDAMQQKIRAHIWPMYKIKLGKADDLHIIEALREVTAAPFRVDANEGWTFYDAQRLIPELKKLNVTLVEQPLARDEWDAMKELKATSILPLYADESCRTEDEVSKCAAAFHGINIKLTKCGGITPALNMIQEARATGLKVMMGSMNESTIGTAAVAHMMPLLDEVDADGPLLLKEDIAHGLHYNEGIVAITERPGLGITFTREKFVRAEAGIS